MLLSPLGSPLHPLYPGFKLHGEISTIHDVSVLTIELRRQKMNSGDGWFGCCHSTAKHGGLLVQLLKFNLIVSIRSLWNTKCSEEIIQNVDISLNPTWQLVISLAVCIRTICLMYTNQQVARNKPIFNKSFRRIPKPCTTFEVLTTRFLYGGWSKANKGKTFKLSLFGVICLHLYSSEAVDKNRQTNPRDASSRNANKRMDHRSVNKWGN